MHTAVKPRCTTHGVSGAPRAAPGQRCVQHRSTARPRHGPAPDWPRLLLALQQPLGPLPGRWATAGHLAGLGFAAAAAQLLWSTLVCRFAKVNMYLSSLVSPAAIARSPAAQSYQGTAPSSAMGVQGALDVEEVRARYDRGARSPAGGRCRRRAWRICACLARRCRSRPARRAPTVGAPGAPWRRSDLARKLPALFPAVAAGSPTLLRPVHPLPPAGCRRARRQRDVGCRGRRPVSRGERCGSRREGVSTACRQRRCPLAATPWLSARGYFSCDAAQ